MSIGTVYDISTGQVRWQIEASDENMLQQSMLGDDFGVYSGQVDGNLYYIDHTSQTVLPRPEFTLTVDTSVIANITDEAVITGIPSGTSVTWPDGVVTVETDGQVELSTDTPGLYRFTFELWPYQLKEITIEAVAAV